MNSITSEQGRAVTMTDSTPSGTACRAPFTPGSLVSPMELNDHHSRIRSEGSDHDAGTWSRVLVGVANMLNESDEAVVRREGLCKHLHNRERVRYQAMQVPFIYLYYIFFAAMLLGHEKIADTSAVERQFRDMLSGTSFEGLQVVKVSGHKNMGNIDTVADVYNFLQDAMLPTFLPSFNSSSPPLELDRVLRYNQLIGGLLLEQTRKPRVECATSYPEMGPFDDSERNPFLLNFSCYPSSASGDTGCFGPAEAMEGFCPGDQAVQGRRLRPKKMAKGPKLAAGAWNLVEPVLGERFSIVFHEHEGLEGGLRKLLETKENNWINDQSSWVGLRLFVMNPDLSLYCSLVVNVFFLKSGELIPLMQSFSLTAEAFPHVGIVILDTMWILLWCHLFGSCVWSLFWACTDAESRREYFFSLWTFIDWAAMLMGLFMIYEGVTYLEQLELVKGTAMNVAFTKPAATGVSPQVLHLHKQSVQELHDLLVDVNAYMDDLRRYVGLYCVVLTLRVFRAFEVQPRLAIVMRTVIVCLPDLLHFMLVLVTMHTAFVLAGMLLFGHRMFLYSRFDLAFQTCLLTLFGSMDYQSLAMEHPWTAFVWFFLFIVVMYMIMINMALAIFMDVYAGMKNEVETSETLPQQIMELWRKLRSVQFCGKGNYRVSSSAVLQSVEGMKEAMITKSSLQQVCPGLDSLQATQLIEHVQAAEAYEEKETLSLSDAFKYLQSIRTSIVQIQEHVDFLCKSEDRQLYKNSIASNMAPAQLHPDAEYLLSTLEGRAGTLEEFMNEVMSYLVLRGKDAKGRLEAIEEFLKKNPKWTENAKASPAAR